MHVNSILRMIFPLANEILMLCLPSPTQTVDRVPSVCNFAVHTICFIAFKHSTYKLLSSGPILRCLSCV